MLFDSWTGLARVLVVGILAYLAMVFLLRISGKRTLSKMNAFDFIVTIALGSTLATVLLSEDVALAEGILAFALLIFLQYIITWLSVRSSTVFQLIKAKPELLFYQGQFLESVMKQERVNEAEIRAAIRTSGIARLEDVAAVVLETDGTFSVLSNLADGSPSSLANVARHELLHP